MEYLDFELPIKELEEQYNKCVLIGEESDVDMTESCKNIEKKLLKTKTEIYKNLTAWQRVQLSRHPSRPYTLDHITALSGESFMELHGDRTFKDDKAMVGGLGKIGNQSFMFIGQQKGYNTKTRQYRNFGMSNPEGYRKALRLMKMAEKFSIPVITFYIFEMTRLKTPIITIVIGEGASGGALGIGVGDRVYMMENTWYSVISPESCSSILWRSWEHKEEAAEALKLTAEDMKKQKLIDGIIKEPLGGAHFDRETAFMEVEKTILKAFNELKKLTPKELVKKRMEKYAEMGVFKG